MLEDSGNVFPLHAVCGFREKTISFHSSVERRTNCSREVHCRSARVRLVAALWALQPVDEPLTTFGIVADLQGEAGGRERKISGEHYIIVSKEERTYRRKEKAANTGRKDMLTVFTCSTTLAGVYKSPSYSTLNASTQDDGVLWNTQAACTLALPQSSWELRAGPDKQTSRNKATLTAAIPSVIQEPRRITVIQY